MSFLVVPVWQDRDGVLSSQTYPAVPTEREVPALVEQARRDARMAGGTNLRVMVVDDVAGRVIARVRPR